MIYTVVVRVFTQSRVCAGTQLFIRVARTIATNIDLGMKFPITAILRFVDVM